MYKFVLKCTQDLFQSGMVRHTDIEMTVTKEEIYIHTSLETESTIYKATQGRTSIGQEAEGEKGEMGTSAFDVFPREGMGEIG